MDLRNSKSIELRNFYFTNVWKLFKKIFLRIGKIFMWNSIQVLSNQVSKKFSCTFEDIDSRESHAKLHKNQVTLWEQI